MTETQETKALRAIDELKIMREEVRARVKRLGKDAVDVAKEAEELLKVIEARLASVGEMAAKDAQQAVTAVGVRLNALKQKLERRVAPPPEKH